MIDKRVKDVEWDFPNPHIVPIKVEAKHIDVIGHVNNVVYLRWLERCAWSHSEALGMDWEAYQRLGCAMVARRHELDYLKAAFEGDDLQVATWIVQSDQKLMITRAYQIVRLSDQSTLMRAQTKWVCMDLKKGKAKRMPPEFAEAYVTNI